MQNDYLDNTAATCLNCGSSRLTIQGENAVCEVCGTSGGERPDVDSSGWDRIWRASCGESIRYQRL